MRHWGIAALLAVSVAGCSLLLTGDDLVGPEKTDGSPGDAPGDPAAEDDSGVCDAIPRAVDPRNCGVCGRDCLGGKCEGNKCQPSVFAADQESVLGVAANATHVYWSTTDAIMRMQTRGSASPTTLASGESPGYVSVTAKHVYWVRRAAGEIRRATLEGESIETVTAGLDSPLGLGVMAGQSNDIVFWTESSPEAGTVKQLLPDGGHEGKFFVLDPQDLEVTDPGTPTWYLAQRGKNEVTATLGIVGAPIAVFSITEPAGIALDGPIVYVTGRDVVARGERGNGGLTTLVANQKAPAGIAVVGKVVYWAERGENRIMRLVVD